MARLGRSFPARPIIKRGLPIGPVIAFGTASNSGYQAASSSYTFSRFVDGDNRFLAVDVSLLSVPGTTVTSVVDDDGGGNVVLTFIGAKNTVSGAGRVECWGLVAPTAGTKNIRVNLSASIASAATAVAYTGVHQTTPTEAFNSAQATNVGAADATVTVTPIADKTWLHAAIATDDTAITAGQTSRNNVTGAGGSGANEDTGPISPATGTVVSYTAVDALATWAIAGYAIRPVSAAGPTRTITTSIDTVIQTTATAQSSLNTAIQTTATTQFGLDAAIQTTATAQASLNAAIQTALQATASLSTAVQDSHLSVASLDAAVELARTAATSLDLAVQSSGSAITSLDAQVQADHLITTSLDAFVQAGSSVNVSLSATVLAAALANAGMDAVLQVIDRNVTIGMNAALRQAFMSTAVLQAAVQQAHTVTLSLDAQVQESSTVSLGIDAAIQNALNATASVNAAIAETANAQASLNAIISLSLSATAAMDTAIGITPITSTSISAFVFESGALPEPRNLIVTLQLEQQLTTITGTPLNQIDVTFQLDPSFGKVIVQ